MGSLVQDVKRLADELAVEKAKVVHLEGEVDRVTGQRDEARRLTDAMAIVKAEVVHLKAEVRRVTEQRDEANIMLAEKQRCLDRATECLDDTREVKLRVLLEKSKLVKALVGIRAEALTALGQQV